MTDRLVEMLYFVSSGLLAPTLIVLLVFLISTLVMLGGLAREAVDRLSSMRSWRRFLVDLRSAAVPARVFRELKLIGYPGRFQRELNSASDKPVIVKKCLEDLEIDITSRLSWHAFGTRLGPMLGLVGTLVPLGPALTGLASGDIQSLSGNLVIAFTTTVFGILVGGASYAAGLIRRNWYERDLSDLEFVASLWMTADAESRLRDLSGGALGRTELPSSNTGDSNGRYDAHRPVSSAATPEARHA